MGPFDVAPSLTPAVARYENADAAFGIRVEFAMLNPNVQPQFTSAVVLMLLFWMRTTERWFPMAAVLPTEFHFRRNQTSWPETRRAGSGRLGTNDPARWFAGLAGYR